MFMMVRFWELVRPSQPRASLHSLPAIAVAHGCLSGTLPPADSASPTHPPAPSLLSSLFLWPGLVPRVARGGHPSVRVPRRPRHRVHGGLLCPRPRAGRPARRGGRGEEHPRGRGWLRGGCGWRRLGRLGQHGCCCQLLLRPFLVAGWRWRPGEPLWLGHGAPGLCGRRCAAAAACGRGGCLRRGGCRRDCQEPASHGPCRAQLLGEMMDGGRERKEM